jgi:hypothetical protein
LDTSACIDGIDAADKLGELLRCNGIGLYRVAAEVSLFVG